MCESIYPLRAKNIPELCEACYYFNLDNSLFECSTCFLTKIVKQIKPIKVYNNFKEDKQQIKQDQKGKTGVYCLVNLINDHIYIGSSVNLAVRMSNYLNTTFLKNRKNNNMPIIQALLKTLRRARKFCCFNCRICRYRKFICTGNFLYY